MGIGGVDRSRLSNALGIEERMGEVRKEEKELQCQRHGSKHKKKKDSGRRRISVKTEKAKMTPAFEGAATQ